MIFPQSLILLLQVIDIKLVHFCYWNCDTSHYDDAQC